MHEHQPTTEVLPMSVTDAVAEVQAILANEMAKGATDSEPATLNKLTKQISSGEITPEEGVRQARGLSSSRMDYH